MDGYRWIDRGVDGWKMIGWMDYGWVDECMTDGWMIGWMGRLMYIIVSQLQKLVV